MKTKFIIFLIGFILFSCQQKNTTRLYNYQDGSAVEEIQLFKDSFKYTYNFGITKIEVDGIIKHNKDTLIFKSYYQPKLERISETFNETLDENKIEVIVIDKSSLNLVSMFGVNNNDKYIHVRVNSESREDDKGSVIKYLADKRIVSPNKQFMFYIHRQKYHYYYKFKYPKSNSILIDLQFQPQPLDYVFFTDFKAIVNDQGLKFLPPNNELHQFFSFYKKSNEGDGSRLRDSTKVYKIKENNN